MQQTIQGLSSKQVNQLKKEGKTNSYKNSTSRTYFSIIQENVFTAIHLVLFIITVMLIAVGRFSDAFIYIGIVLFNVGVGVVQEILAKKKLDAIALLNRPSVLVIRDSSELSIKQEEVVLGDILKITPGDQAVVDGFVVKGFGEMDESLLSGESHAVTKKINDTILSGSFGVSGTIYMQATKIGAESYASTLTVEAKKFQKNKTPLQKEIGLAIWWLMVFVFAFAGIVFIQKSFFQGIEFKQYIPIIAVIAGLIPNALFATITLAYALGAVRISAKEALVQELNAVESLSNVNVLCVDKTGTLTTNQLKFDGFTPLFGASEQKITEYLKTYASLTTTPNSTIKSILDYFKISETSQNISQDLTQNFPQKLSNNLSKKQASQTESLAEIPFNSTKKLSSHLISFTNADVQNQNLAQESPKLQESQKSICLVLGAVEFVSPFIAPEENASLNNQENSQNNSQESQNQINQLSLEYSKKGLRTLLFAFKECTKEEEEGYIKNQIIPQNLQPLAIVQIADQLREEAKETLEHFAKIGVEVKIISGDNPNTVQSLARQLGMIVDDNSIISGLDLDSLSDEEFKKMVLKTSIFGRINPKQKEKIVEFLKLQNKYVAMVGDGVNDILSIKKAQVGIAMQNGSSATRAVADIILLNNSFSSLPFGFKEGQKIVSGLHATTKIFLARVLNILILLLLVQIFALPFLLSIKQSSLIAFITSGIPAFGLTLWAFPQLFKFNSHESFFKSLLSFSIPASVITSLTTFLLYLSTLFFGGYFKNSASASNQISQNLNLIIQEAQSTAVIFLLICGLFLVIFAFPFHKKLQFHKYTQVSFKPTFLVLALAMVFAFIYLNPDLRNFWEITQITWLQASFILLAFLIWLGLLLFSWKKVLQIYPHYKVNKADKEI